MKSTSLPVTQFSFLRQPSKKKATPFFDVYSSPNEMGLMRIAVIISRKVSSKAVTRNRNRRMIKSALQVSCLQKNYFQDLLVIVKKDIQKVPFDVIVAEWEKIIKPPN